LTSAIQKQLTVWRYIANGIIANAMPCSQNRDLKCNRICKLPVLLFCLGTFLWSLFFLFKLPIFTLSSMHQVWHSVIKNLAEQSMVS